MNQNSNDRVLTLSCAGMTVALSRETGAILSCQIHGHEMLAYACPLFCAKLLDDNGDGHKTDSDMLTMTAEASSDSIFLHYINEEHTFSAKASVTAENGELHWHISVDNRTDSILEWVEYPCIAVKDELLDNGGDATLFWPALEGQLITDSTARDKHWFKYWEIDGQTGTYGGYYPGSCPMQFMAYYTRDCGLYFAAHDARHMPKTVEYYEKDNGIVLEFRLFASGAMGHFDAGYDMVMRAFTGDWYAAADIYRDWMKEHTALPVKLYENDTLPAWLADSPVVAIYPVRGTKDTGDMTPNCYFPYERALPYIEALAKDFDARIMALPTHWEGPAPWAPPYVWPPFGGEEMFISFVDALHAQGNLMGVYCSGIGWTTYSFLDPTLDLSDKYDAHLMCRTPKNTIEQSRVIGAPIRYGYDMCPHDTKVDDIVAGEILSLARAGCDYSQYFDQNLGGAPSICFARDHGHPPAPGVWENEDMLRLYDRLHTDLAREGRQMLLGCENAASEPFIGHLAINDLRWSVGLRCAKPVPAYAYLFHEYLNNFMGNQSGFADAFSLEENPDNMLFRIAYAFTAGDMLTVVLAGEGLLHWGWSVPWDIVPPKQEPIKALIRNLNPWRTKRPEYLRFGRMEQPHPVTGCGEFVLYRRDGTTVTYPQVLTSRFTAPRGTTAQLLVNYQKTAVTCQVTGAAVYMTPDGEAVPHTGVITVPPLSAIMIEE